MLLKVNIIYTNLLSYQQTYNIIIGIIKLIFLSFPISVDIADICIFILQYIGAFLSLLLGYHGAAFSIMRRRPHLSLLINESADEVRYYCIIISIYLIIAR